MAVACPVCEREFREQRGVQQHIGSVHEAPWQDEETLRILHQQYGLSGHQIAERFDCTPATINRWLNQYDIFTPVSFMTKPDKGYEQWRHGNEMVYVHRLLAVAEFGFDAVCDNVIHHKTEIPWDNRPDNIEPLSNLDHRGEHKKAQGLQRKAIAYAYEFTDKSSYDIAETCDYAANSVRRIHSEYFD